MNKLGAVFALCFLVFGLITIISPHVVYAAALEEEITDPLDQFPLHLVVRPSEGWNGQTVFPGSGKWNVASPPLIQSLQTEYTALSTFAKDVLKLAAVTPPTGVTDNIRTITYIATIIFIAMIAGIAYSGVTILNDISQDKTLAANPAKIMGILITIAGAAFSGIVVLSDFKLITL